MFLNLKKILNELRNIRNILLIGQKNTSVDLYYVVDIMKYIFVVVQFSNYKNHKWDNLS